MLPSSHIDYKSLFEETYKKLQASEVQNASLKNQVTALTSQNKTLVHHTTSLNAVIRDQQSTIKLQDQKINERDKVIVLKDQAIGQQTKKISAQNKLIEAQQQTIIGQQKTIEDNQKQLRRIPALEHTLMLLNKYLRGYKSEKFYSENVIDNRKVVQMTLDIHAEKVDAVSVSNALRIVYVRPAKAIVPKKKHSGRGMFPDDMEVVETRITPDNLPQRAKKIGEVITEQLEVVPPRYFVNRTIREEFLVPDEEDDKHKYRVASLPAHPIAKCKAGISMLANVAIDKFLYHLPVHRQHQRLKHYGIDVPYSTLVDWCNGPPEVLLPLYKVLLKEAFNSGYLHLDETPYRILDPTKNKKGRRSHRGQMYVFANPIQNFVCFRYRNGRGHKDIDDFLEGFQGFLHTDGLQTYVKHGRKKGIIPLNCWAHARRKFDEAMESDPLIASTAIEQFIRPLYIIEEQCAQQNLSYDEITAIRQKHALPVIKAFYSWLKNLQPNTIGRTPISIAINYVLNRCEQLIAYTNDGMLSIDNNIAERAIRDIAMGRKNYMFAGSVRGAEHAAIMYSFFVTCKINNIKPQEWLMDVLTRISDHPMNRLSELLPQFWKPLTKTIRTAA